MVNKKFWLGIPVIALVLGIAVIGCAPTDDNDSDINGTWALNGTTTYTYEIKFSGGNYEAYRDDKPYTKGTYSAKEGEIVMTPTHIHGNYFTFSNITIAGLESKWYKKDELKSLTNYDDNVINLYYSIRRGNYSVNGNTLILSLIGGGGGTYTKK